jgi:carbon-monoxide dehydrogenase small subunit
VADGGQLHPMQAAFMESFGLQCGYCTPGFVMAALQILSRYPSASDDEIRHQLKGNICRCTGYQAIVQSILSGLEKVRVTSALRSSARQDLT